MPVINKPNQHFDATLYTGAGGTQTVSGLQFQPDFIWGKARSAAYGSALFDSVRGYGSAKGLVANLTQAEGTVSAQYGFVSAATSTGFTAAAGTDGSNPNAALNESGVTYVAWSWKAGGTAVTNNNGSVTSQVSVNTTAGFSIVSYASGSAGQKTVGHGLGVTPSMIITKSRDNGSYNWSIYHSSVIDTTSKFLRFTTDGIVTSSTIWGAALPTSTVFGITSDNGVPANNNCIAYCWAPIAGYSAFGSYTGNGSTDGPFVYLGFRPRWILFKRSDSGSHWVVYDTARDTFNALDKELAPNNSNAEQGTVSSEAFDLLSNGFKIRSVLNGEFNVSTATYIYAAFAEAPFKFANAR
jgi:hypothetical protein